ncbi:hypothetical protein N7539_002745 [Penicillium diatomitis]|uniref:Uncharacterized protein n=1 Tax=Penicillium diatomitis TaxID=2819901 RepID=A0A9W9XFV2_9EURO|nr:uncharacterized protein N7539_002745 [Penicillium diatomitis]KAJ5491178.1 hypothetical protein N7539_002745 [Penicillium diatomitis]
MAFLFELHRKVDSAILGTWALYSQANLKEVVANFSRDYHATHFPTSLLSTETSSPAPVRPPAANEQLEP